MKLSLSDIEFLFIPKETPKSEKVTIRYFNGSNWDEVLIRSDIKQIYNKRTGECYEPTNKTFPATKKEQTIFANPIRYGTSER